MAIRQLPPSVVNKIAAGEVIERPASVVKELMENSVDAGARRIVVSIEQGGLELVRVADDGCGIPAEELTLAVASHATSKIANADDLFRVQTLGFRGEALASIAEVSRFTIRSRPGEAAAGAQLEVNGGLQQEIAPCGCSPGTTMEVRNLFFNTPVRRRFLKTTNTEMGHITEAFTRIALAHPNVHFTLSHNDRELHDLPPVDDWRQRIGALFGADLARDLIDVESSDGQVTLRGYAANPTHNRAHNRMQYLLLNGRAIRDRSLQHALGEAYRGLLLTGRCPIVFLRIDMPADLVDVNVHPTKLEVRFQDGGTLYGQLLGTLRTRFLSTDLTARLQPVGPKSEAAAAHDPAKTEQLRQDLVAWAKGELATQKATLGQIAPADAAADDPFGVVAGASANAAAPVQGRIDLNYPPRAPLELVKLDRSYAAVDPDDEDEDEPELVEARGELNSLGFRGPSSTGATWRADRPAAALQVHNRYLIAESDDGMVVIDQHALHERILYEQLREKVLAGALESQRLLVPETVDLTSNEAAAVIEAKDLLAQLGVTVEPFGGDTVLVSSYPAMMASLSPTALIRDLADRLMSGGKLPDRRDLTDELLHMMSCKAAVKAGDPLSPAEIEALLEQRHLAQDAHHCPHGRPTALVFTREELDRQFKRT